MWWYNLACTKASGSNSDDTQKLDSSIKFCLLAIDFYIVIRSRANVLLLLNLDQGEGEIDLKLEISIEIQSVICPNFV